MPRKVLQQMATDIANTETALAPYTGIVVREQDGDDYRAPHEPSGDAADFTLESPYPTPSDDAFGGEEFAHAEDLTTLAAAIMDRHHEHFWHAKNESIAFYWKRKAGYSLGQVQWGACQRTPPLARYHSHSTFTIWLAADYFREKATVAIITAALAHELCHIGYNADKGEAKIISHDFEGFNFEIETYGLWQRQYRDAASVMQAALDLDPAAV